MNNLLPKQPTPAELEILKVLWQSPSTVRQVQNYLNERRAEEVGYTTVLKLMQIMTEKKLISRDETNRPQMYYPQHPQEQTQKQLVFDLLNRVFEGSAKKLVMHALSDKLATDDELNQIEKLLNKFEGDVK